MANGLLIILSILYVFRLPYVCCTEREQSAAREGERGERASRRKEGRKEGAVKAFSDGSISISEIRLLLLSSSAAAVAASATVVALARSRRCRRRRRQKPESHYYEGESGLRLCKGLTPSERARERPNGGERERERMSSISPQRGAHWRKERKRKSRNAKCGKEWKEETTTMCTTQLCSERGGRRRERGGLAEDEGIWSFPALFLVHTSLACGGFELSSRSDLNFLPLNYLCACSHCLFFLPLLAWI